MRALAAALLAGLVGASPVAQAGDGAPDAIAFVHVEANVGSASGGHTALRIGERTYHFQVVEDRVLRLPRDLRLQRDDWELFRFRYNTLQSRPLHVAWVPLGAEAVVRLRDHLDAIFLGQRQERRRLEERDRDLALLDALAGERRGVPTRGAGLLDPTGSPTPDGRALAARVAARLGPGGLDARVAGAAAVLRRPPRAGEEQRWREALSTHAALRALREGRPLDARARVEPAAPRLGDAERRSLEALRAGLEEALVRWIDAPQPARGRALWLLVARHRAAGESLARERLVLLDAFPDGAPRLSARATEAQREELAAVATFLEERLARTRARVLGGGLPSERGWARLEGLAGRMVEYAAAAALGRPAREAEAALPVPERSRDLPPPAGLAPDELQAARRASLERVRANHRARLAASEAYDLLHHNCVTALADALDGGLGGAAGVAAELGGRVDAREPLAFVPFVYFGKLARRLPVTRVERLPGHRLRELHRMADASSAWAVELRESNVLSSRLYRRRDADGSFLFFTDREPFTRPLRGAVNLLWAAGDGALGLLAAPFDRARRLERAGRGALFSLPELFFVNVRKGSFDARSLASPTDAPP